MADRTGLCWGTLEGAPFEELVASASHAGFADISITPAMYFEARARGRSDEDLRALVRDSGVTVAVIDPLITGLPGIPTPDQVPRRFRSTFEHGEDDCFRVAEAVGARAVNVAHYLGAPTDLAAVTDAIAGIAERAARRGLDIFVEFIPDGAIPDLETAATIVRAIGAANCGVTFDTWHHWRCGGDEAELRAVGPDVVRSAQVSDARTSLRGTGTTPPTRDRMLPGEGDIPLAAMLRIVRASRPDVLISLEVFDQSATDPSSAARAVRAKAALDDLLASLPTE